MCFNCVLTLHPPASATHPPPSLPPSPPLSQSVRSAQVSPSCPRWSLRSWSSRRACPGTSGCCFLWLCGLCSPVSLSPRAGAQEKEESRETLISFYLYLYLFVKWPFSLFFSFFFSPSPQPRAVRSSADPEPEPRSAHRYPALLPNTDCPDAAGFLFFS